MSSITIPITRKTADDFVLVSEDDIILAIQFAWEHYNEVIEPSSATALAAILSGRISDKPSVLIITGGNIQPQSHQKLIGR